ncbi:hypothetical protein HZC09_02880 [Candidatus Micrarchaeota archaeon]|nr:hypothetical protein [Candidatus Micrarchaeota archaeon]
MSLEESKTHWAKMEAKILKLKEEHRTLLDSIPETIPYEYGTVDITPHLQILDSHMKKLQLIARRVKTLKTAMASLGRQRSYPPDLIKEMSAGYELEIASLQKKREVIETLRRNFEDMGGISAIKARFDLFKDIFRP